MGIGSGYDFPIFISSTHHNLKDLRAELADHLSRLGYHPFLSSEEGFPDQSPTLQPWESCLAVLENCFLVVVVIDGRYGTPLDWPAYGDLFNGKKVSPTHAEFIYARARKKRTLVFIRREVLSYYEPYRLVLQDCDGKHEKLRKTKRLPLPPWVDVDTLAFIKDVKTSRPIHWITEFDDVTAIKHEVQAKLVNELADVFRSLEGNARALALVLNRALERIPEDQIRSILVDVGATRPFVESLERAQAELKQTRDQAAEKDGVLHDLRRALEAADKRNEKAVKELETKLEAATREASHYRSRAIESERKVTERLVEGVFPHVSHDLTISGGASFSTGASYAGLGFGNPGITLAPPCPGCGEPMPSLSFLQAPCLNCGRVLCGSCMASTLSGRCSKCELASTQFR